MSEHDRLERLIEEARQLSGGKMILGGIENLPREVAEQFMERVIASEKAAGANADTESARPSSSSASRAVNGNDESS